MRLFIAIPIIADKPLQNTVLSLQNNLLDEKITFTDLQNIHLTLLFLGDISASLVPEISSLMEAVAYDHDPFAMEIKRLGIFGSSYDPKVIWVGAEPKEKLQSIHADMALAMQKIGYHADSQNFVPHLTLGRIRKLRDKHHFQNSIEKHVDKTFQVIDVKEVVLYESCLTANGPIYNIQGVAPLGC